jgi:hypothetical protein
MKKSLSLIACALLVGSVSLMPSCKKIYHATNITPANARLLGYTKITTRVIIAPFTPTPVITENYSFSYDDNNRLSQVLYATNDSNVKKLGLLNLRMSYDYSGGNIYRTVYNLKNANVVERDTFSLNAYGQLVSSVFPWESHSYTYQGKLIATQKDTYSDSGTTISATYNFTSDNHDLLHQEFNGVLTATFPDSGIRAVILPADTTRDTILTYPLDVTWTTVNVSSGGYDSTYTYHNGVNSHTDQLTGYSQKTVKVDAKDANGAYVRSVYFPAGLNPQKFYQIYDFLSNRTGDYLQLESFKTFGVNVYQNEHLIKTMTTAYDTTNVTYDIDAQSKITQTHVVIKDKLGNKTTIDYKLQYELN